MIVSSDSVLAVHTVDVTKTYRVGHTDYPALRGVTLRIEKGGFVSVMGPSGSGKSTLLNIIAALDPPTSGRVFIDGIDLQRLNEDGLALLRNWRLGFVYQSFNLIGRLTTLENVEIPLISLGMPEKDRQSKSLKMLSAVGLNGKANKRPTELSGGEQQRVAIARALVTNPAVVIADEPTGNLDSKTGLEVVSHFVRVNKEHGTTIILVTHNEEIANMAQRIVSIRDGLVEKEEYLQRIDSFSER